jgi:hypothetical protein
MIRSTTIAIVATPGTVAPWWTRQRDRSRSGYPHIRIDAKRQALDALDVARRSAAHTGDGNGDGANRTEIPAIVEVSDDLTSQFAFAGLAALQ